MIKTSQKINFLMLQVTYKNNMSDIISVWPASTQAAPNANNKHSSRANLNCYVVFRAPSR